MQCYYTHFLFSYQLRHVYCNAYQGNVHQLGHGIQCLAKKLVFLATYKAKWGGFKLNYSTLKVLVGSWSPGSKKIWIRSFKWGTGKLSMTIYSKVIGHQSSQSKIIRIAWSLPAKIAMLEWGPGFIPSLGELWRHVTLQSFSLQGSIVPHLKDLTRICLEPEDQDPSRTLKINYALLNKPNFTS